MPIHECTLEGGGKGFQWGSGKCYPTRAQAEKQAQAAYANGYTGDGERIPLTDSFVMDGVHRSKDGYLAAYANVARTGIQIYKGKEVGRPDLGEVRVYRPPEEVFNRDAMKSMAHRPVTMPHPAETVNAKNWKKYAKGHTGDEVVRDGDHVKVQMVVMDSDAINAIESGDSKELSMGYSTELKWTPGKTDDGQEYDAVQTEIRCNHLAIVPVARGGKNLRFGDAATNTHDANCPHCGAQVPDGVDECPTCGANLDTDYNNDEEWNDNWADAYDDEVEHTDLEDEHLDDDWLTEHNLTNGPHGKLVRLGGSSASSQPKRPRGRPRKDQSQRQTTHSPAPEAPKIPQTEQDLRAHGYRFHHNNVPNDPARGSHYAYNDLKGFRSGPHLSRELALASAHEHVANEMAPEIEAHRLALAQHDLEKQQHQSLAPYELGSVPHFLEQAKIFSPKNISTNALKQGNKVFKTQEEAYRTILANRAHWNRATVTSTDLTETKPYRVPKVLGGETVGYFLKKHNYAKKEEKKFYKISHDALVDLTFEDSIVEIDDVYDPNQPRDPATGRWTETQLSTAGYKFGYSPSTLTHTVEKMNPKADWRQNLSLSKHGSSESAIHAASVHFAEQNKLLSPEDYVKSLRAQSFKQPEFPEFEHSGLSQEELDRLKAHYNKNPYGLSPEELDRLKRHVASQSQFETLTSNPSYRDITSFSGLNPPLPNNDPRKMKPPSFPSGTDILGKPIQSAATESSTFNPISFNPISFSQNTSSYSAGPKHVSADKNELEAYIKQQQAFWKKARIKTHTDTTVSLVPVEPGFFGRVFKKEKYKPVTTTRKYYSIGHDGAVVDAEAIPNIEGESEMSKMINIDGVPVETTDVGAAIVQRYIDKLTGDIKSFQDAKKKDDDGDAEKDKVMDGLKKQIETKDGEIVALKKQLADAQAAANPDKLDALVKDRSAVIDSAKLILDASFVFDGKKSEDIRRAAVSAKLGDATVKEMTDAAIEGAFKALTVDAKNNGGGARPIARALYDQQRSQPGVDMRDAAFAEYEKNQINAWKAPARN